MLRKSIPALALLAGAFLPLGDAARAGVAAGLAGGTARVSQAEFAQFNPFDIPGAILGSLVFGGRQYCWYDDGWQGPGYYWCGYGYYQGYGYGGGEGWHGWQDHRRWEGQEHGHRGGEHHGGAGGGQQHHGGASGGQQHQGGNGEKHEKQ